MSDRTYVYVVHIAASAEKVWQAITDGEIYRQWWDGRRVEMDWKVGSVVTFRLPDGRVESQGEILVCDPPKSLSHTWYDPADAASALRPERVAWQIVASGPGTVKLTLVHEGLSEEGYQGISQGWPAFISSLKSLLELGKPLAYQA